MPERVDGFLAETAAAARGGYGGRVTYASGRWERVDRGPFDIVSRDAYRSTGDVAALEGEAAALTRHGKPVAVREFGCRGYRGASGRGGLGWDIVNRDVPPPRPDGDRVRDGGGQRRTSGGGQRVVKVLPEGRTGATQPGVARSSAR